MLLYFIFVLALGPFRPVVIYKDVIPDVETFDKETKKIHYKCLKNLFLSINKECIDKDNYKNARKKANDAGSIGNGTIIIQNKHLLTPEYNNFQNITYLLVRDKFHTKCILRIYEALENKTDLNEQDAALNNVGNAGISADNCKKLQDHFDEKVRNKGMNKITLLNFNLCLLLLKAVYTTEKNNVEFCKLKHMINYFCIMAVYGTNVYGDERLYIIHNSEKIKNKKEAKKEKGKPKPIERNQEKGFPQRLYHVFIIFNYVNLEELKHLRSNKRYQLAQDDKNEVFAKDAFSRCNFLYVNIGALAKKITNFNPSKPYDAKQNEERILDAYYHIRNNILTDMPIMKDFFCLGSTWSLEPTISKDSDHNAILCFVYKKLDYDEVLKQDITQLFAAFLKYQLNLVDFVGLNVSQALIEPLTVQLTIYALNFYRLCLKDCYFDSLFIEETTKAANITKPNNNTVCNDSQDRNEANIANNEKIIRKTCENVKKVFENFTKHYEGITTEKLAFLQKLNKSGDIHDEWRPLVVDLELLEKSELIVYPQKTGILSTLQKYIEDNANKKRRLNVQVFFFYETYMQHFYDTSKDKSDKERLDQIKLLSEELRDLFIEEVKCIKKYHEFISNCEFDVKVDYKVFRGFIFAVDDVLENKYKPKDCDLEPYDLLVYTHNVLFHVMNKKPKESNFLVTKFCIFQHQFLKQTPVSVQQLKLDFNLLVGNIDTKAYISKKAKGEGDTLKDTTKDFIKALTVIYSVPNGTDKQFKEICRRKLEALKEKLVSDNGILRRASRPIMPETPKKYLFKIRMQLSKHKILNYIGSKKSILTTVDSQNHENTCMNKEQQNEVIKNERRKNVLDIIDKAINNDESEDLENVPDTKKSIKEDEVAENITRLKLLSIGKEGPLTLEILGTNSFDAVIKSGESPTTSPPLLIIINFLSDNNSYYCDMYPFNTQASLNAFLEYYKSKFDGDECIQALIKGREIYISRIKMYVDIYFHMLNGNEASITEQFANNASTFQNDLDWEIVYDEAGESIVLCMGINNTYITFMKLYYISIIYIDDAIVFETSSSDFEPTQTSVTRKNKRSRKKKLHKKIRTVPIDMEATKVLSDEDIAEKSISAILRQRQGKVCTGWNLEDFKKELVNELTKQHVFVDISEFKIDEEYKKIFADVYESILEKNNINFNGINSRAEKMLKTLLWESLYTLFDPQNEKKITPVTALKTDKTACEAKEKQVYDECNETYKEFLVLTDENAKNSKDDILPCSNWIQKKYKNDTELRTNVTFLLKNCRNTHSVGNEFINTLDQKFNVKEVYVFAFDNKKIEDELLLKLFIDNNAMKEIIQVCCTTSNLDEIETTVLIKILALRIFLLFIEEGDLQEFNTHGLYTEKVKTSLLKKFTSKKSHENKTKELVEGIGFCAAKYFYELYQTKEYKKSVRKTYVFKTSRKPVIIDKNYNKKLSVINYIQNKISDIKEPSGKNATIKCTLPALIEKLKILETWYVKTKLKIIKGYLEDTCIKIFGTGLAKMIVESCQQKNPDNDVKESGHINDDAVDVASNDVFTLPNSVKPIYYKILICRKENAPLSNKIKLLSKVEEDCKTLLDKTCKCLLEYQTQATDTGENFEVVDGLSVTLRVELYTCYMKDAEDIKKDDKSTMQANS